MSEEPSVRSPEDEAPRRGESFLSRFHRRKTEARLALAEHAPPPTQQQQQDVTATIVEAEPDTAPCDADMPPIESLDADSDYTGFLSPKVSESLRRAALRKLFHGDTFKVIDGLDDYAEDFTSFEALGDIVTADMRHRIEVEAKKQAEALKQTLLEQDAEKPQPADAAIDHKNGDASLDDTVIRSNEHSAEPAPPTDNP